MTRQTRDFAEAFGVAMMLAALLVALVKWLAREAV